MNFCNMLEIKKLCKKFGDKTAVNNISFSIKEGEIVSLIGPNGSGKTTIIKMITGLLQPTNGEILVGGMDVVKMPEKTKKQIGYIPDEPSIWSFMTGEEFIYFTGAMYDIPLEKRQKDLPGLLNKFDLSGIEKEYFEDYSRGNKQKFSILAGLSHEPKLLLIDEPIVGLDPVSAKKAESEFVNFVKNGGSIMLVTHTLTVAQKISDRIGILDKGEIIAIDTFQGLCKLANLPDSASLDDVYQKLVK